MEKAVKKIEDFGYDSFFEADRKRLGLDGFPVARVIAEHKGAYKVINEKGEFLAKITGKQIFNASSREDYPAIGDWVAIAELDPGRAVIRGVLPRKTAIKRKYGDRNKADGKTETQVIGANIDVAFVVESVDRDYSLNRLERYFVLVKDGGARPALILNKIDLISKEELDSKLAEIKNRFADIDAVPTSIVSERGLDELKTRIVPGETCCFLGSSGVGKSSVINKLLGKELIRTGSIGSYSGRGRHITTNREMYFLENGGIVIDNPGMREVGITDVSAGIDGQFDEITALAGSCKYADCAHIHEPDCAVLAATRTGKLDKDKYDNYVRLKKEAEYHQMSSLKKREKDRSFGKFVKNAKKEMKKYE